MVKNMAKLTPRSSAEEESWLRSPGRDVSISSNISMDGTIPVKQPTNHRDK